MICNKYCLLIAFLCSLLAYCEGNIIPLTITPPEIITSVGQTAQITCHWVDNSAVDDLSLADEDDTVIEMQRYRRSDKSAVFNTLFVNVSLIILNIQRNDDQLMVHCSQSGRRSSSASTIRVYVKPKLSGPNGTLYILESTTPRTISFHVSDVNPPVERFQWIFNDTLMLTGDRINENSTATSLELAQPTRHDSGRYTVSVFGPSGNDLVDFELIVMYNEFCKEPEDKSVMNGETFVQKCCHPFGWVYSWGSNRGPVNASSNAKVKLSGDGTVLTYGPVDALDTGLTLTCNVRALDRETRFSSRSATITVRAAPSISVSSSMVVTSEGIGEVVLLFAVTSFTADVDLKYGLNGVLLDSGLMRYVAMDNGSLRINNPTRRDSGTYTLQASNSQGTASASILLQVQYAPVIERIGEQCLVYQVHTDIVIPCGASVVGDPFPGFSWRKCNMTSAGKTCFAPRSEGVNTEGELMLASIRYSDAGTYECIASNSLGEATAMICISVLDPPHPPTGVAIIVQVGTSNPILSWRPPSLEVPNSTVTGYRVLGIPQPITYDSNQGGVANGELSSNSACVEVNCSALKVTVKGKANVEAVLSGLLPGIRYNLTVMSLAHGLRLQSMPSEVVEYRTANGVPGVSSVTARVYGPGAVELSWALAFSGGLPVNKFVIEYRLNDSLSWFKARTVSPELEVGADSSQWSQVSSTVRQIVVYGLEAEKNYLFGVAASNSLGMGKYSATPQAILSDVEGVPSPPAQPQILGWGPNKVVISTTVQNDGVRNVGGSNSSFWLGAYEVLGMVRRVGVTRVSAPDNYTEGEAVVLTWGNTRFHGDLKFQVYAVNQFGPSPLSEASEAARLAIQPSTVRSDLAGLIILCVMSLLNFSVAIAVVVGIIWMCLEWRKKMRSIARRIEIVEATTPKDITLNGPFSSMFGGDRSSPDGRSSLALARPPSPLSEIADLPTRNADLIKKPREDISDV